MEKTEILCALPETLLGWYDRGHRELPWRGTREPYHIWLSEIMLQQTRVEAVRGYYARFLEALPTVEALANCPDEALHKLWEGLGYYSRVRNLKKAAGVILDTHGGVFPREYGAIRALPGIGDYTAGAIASIAFDQKRAAVDGNVLRLLSRLLDDHRSVDSPQLKQEQRLALEAIYPDRAGDFTQALMELGATLCGPNREPQCGLCPCREFCLGHLGGTAGQLPVRTPKKEKRQEDRTVFLLTCNGSWALEKRPGRGLLAGLWQFPNVPGKLATGEALMHLEKLGLRPRELRMELERRHIFTHIQWNMKGIYLEVTEPAGPFTWMTHREIRKQAALPTAFRQFFEETENV